MSAVERSVVGRLGGLQIAEARECDTEVVPGAAELLVDFGGDLELLTRFLPRRFSARGPRAIDQLVTEIVVVVRDEGAVRKNPNR